MLAVQDVQTRPLGAKHFVGTHSISLGDLMQLRDLFAIVLREKESDQDILRVLDRAANDDAFIAALTYNGHETLESYHLTTEAEAALLSGDIGWIETRIGRLDERQQTWLWCRLGQEIW
jgi:hypothetical protein